MLQRTILFLGILALLTGIRLAFFYLFPIKLQDNQTVSFSAVLLEDPRQMGSKQTFSLRLGSLWQSAQVYVETTVDRQILYGQTLVVSGKVMHRLLKSNRTITTIQNAQIEAKNSGILPLVSSLRQKIIDFCENNFSQPYVGLLLGIVFGIKSLLTQQITT